MKVKEENGKRFVFDVIRKKYVVLTPEESVRQQFIEYLITEKKYSRALISVEKGLELNDLQKRTDIMIYNRTGKPVMIIECKAPSVKIDQKTLDQAAGYNMKHNVKFLVVTNGVKMLISRIDFEKKSFEFLKELPEVEEIN